MKFMRLVTMLMFCGLLFVAGCSSNSVDPVDSSAKDCGTTFSEALTGMSNFTITYNASITGDASISRLTYTDGSGLTQVDSMPTVPWTLNVTISPPVTAEMTTVASTTNGSVYIEMLGDNGGSIQFTRQDSCVKSVSP